jgi:hypothetical protein
VNAAADCAVLEKGQLDEAKGERHDGKRREVSAKVLRLAVPLRVAAVGTPDTDCDGVMEQVDAV